MTTVENWLGKDNALGVDIWANKYQYESESFDEWLDRVSNGDKDLRKLIKDKKFLFGGRALSNRGLNNGSYFNCYSSGYCPDDFKEIMNVNKNLGLTYKAQGGQGVSLSKLRPKGTPIGNRYTSDGIIPFLELFNKTTAITSQAGSRKGALMVSLDIRHKQAEEFITIKTNENAIDKANLSLEIDDEFMNAVQEYYDTGKSITLHEKRLYSGHTVEYDIIPIKLYKLMMKCAYDWAEPGCIFSNAFKNYNLMEFDNDYQIETCNPCGEQPLAKDFCCNLGSINLSEFVLNEYSDMAMIDYVSLGEAVDIAINALDILVDENADNHPLKQQKENSLNYRNIGLGLMGVGTALFKLKIKYGSKESKEIINDVFHYVFKKAVLASSKLAKNKGAYPKYKPCVFESSIIKNHFSDVEIELLKKYGLRNCSLVSIAPTGSIATMLGVTGGCEPEFAIKYNRKTDNLKDNYDVYCNEAKYYMSKFNTTTLPSYFVCSSDINWRDRVDMQSVMQEHVDTAISSTVNLPNKISIDEVEQLYLYAWKKGLKGITVYRDGCKRSGILTTDNTKTDDTPTRLSRGDIIEVNDDVVGKKRKLTTGCGSLHCSAFFDPVTGELLETYFAKGSQGGCNNFMIGLSRMISLLARSGANIYSIVEQLNSCGVCPSYAVRHATKRDTSKGSCCPVAIGNALLDMYNEMQSEINTECENENIVDDDAPKCPECGDILVAEGGCFSCKVCGYSKCE